MSYLLLFRGRLAFARIVHTAQGIQAAGIANIGQALGDHLDEKCLIVADPHIGGGMGGKLRFAARPEQRGNRR